MGEQREKEGEKRDADPWVPHAVHRYGSDSNEQLQWCGVEQTNQEEK